MEDAKSISGEKLDKLYEGAARALLEVHKMKEVIAFSDWSVEMKTVRNNMLRTTRMDDRILLIAGNSSEIFEPLLEAFADIEPGFFSSRIEKWRAEKFGLPASLEISRTPAMPSSSRKCSMRSLPFSSSQQHSPFIELPYESPHMVSEMANVSAGRNDHGKILEIVQITQKRS